MLDYSVAFDQQIVKLTKKLAGVKQVQFERIRAVVFDLDGTLVDSALDFAAICRDIGWPSGTPLLEQLAKTFDITERERAEQIIRRHEMLGAEQAVWIPGAEQCLRLLQQSDIPVAILTRNMRSATQRVMQRLQIADLPVLTREDCAAKPDPQGLLLLAEQFSVPVGQLLYVGDYLFDLQTAANAGAVSGLYLNGKNTQFSSLANWTFDHFDELTTALFGTDRVQQLLHSDQRVS